MHSILEARGERFLVEISRRRTNSRTFRRIFWPVQDEGQAAAKRNGVRRLEGISADVKVTHHSTCNVATYFFASLLCSLCVFRLCPSFRLPLLLLSAHGFLLLSSLLSYILFLSCVLFYLDLVAHKLIAPCNGTWWSIRIKDKGTAWSSRLEVWGAQVQEMGPEG